MKQKVRKVWACILVFALMAGLGPWPAEEVIAESSKSFSSDNGEVEITLTESKVNEYWCEYYLAVTNHSNQSIRDWQLTLSVNDISKYRDSYGCQATVKNDKLVVKGQGNGKVVAAGSTYKVNDDFKICFGGEVSLPERKLLMSTAARAPEAMKEVSVPEQPIWKAINAIIH